MAGKNYKKQAAALVLSAAIVFAPWGTSYVNAGTSLSQLQQKQAQLAQKQKQLASKLKSLKADKAKQLEYKSTLDVQIGTLQQQISVTNQKINTMDAAIVQKTQQISDKQKKIDQNYEQLKERLCALYKMGEASTLEIVLNSDSVMDLADKTKLIKSITDHDTKLINTLKADMEAISAQKKEIQAQRAEVAQDKTDLSEKRAELSSMEQEAQKVLSSLEANESQTKAEQEKASKQQQQAAAEIDQWWKEYYANQNKDNGGKGTTYVGGQFTWPVPGFTNISCGYSSSHRAIDINRTGGKSIAGTPIVAANGGKIVVAKWHYSYGNYVMIDHGGGYSTLYAHASSLAVSAGQTVKKGQTIAYVGSTGNSTGPHLHFEIRVNGTRQNPFSWFKKG